MSQTCYIQVVTLSFSSKSYEFPFEEISGKIDHFYSKILVIKDLSHLKILAFYVSGMSHDVMPHDIKLPELVVQSLNFILRLPAIMGKHL